MAHEQRLATFWLVHLIMLGLFGVELILVLSVWFKARVPGLPADAPRWRKLGASVRYIASRLFSSRVWRLLGALVVDGMVHRRLYRKDFQRWAVHISVFGSWFFLGILSILTGFVVEILPLLGMSPSEIATIPFLGHMYHADIWWVALLNEVIGLIALGGMILVIYRRFIRRDPQLRTIPTDGIVIGLLTLIALSGFPTETFRLLADYTTGTGAFLPAPFMLSQNRLPQALYPVWGPQFGFVGYVLARMLGRLSWQPEVWTTLHSLFFWVHFALVSTLLFLLPFSRFFHVVMSPMVVAYNTMHAQESGHFKPHADPALPHPRA